MEGLMNGCHSVMNQFQQMLGVDSENLMKAKTVATPGGTNDSITSVALAVIAAVGAVCLVSFALKFTIDILFLPAIALALVAIGFGARGSSAIFVSPSHYHRSSSWWGGGSSPWFATSSRSSRPPSSSWGWGGGGRQAPGTNVGGGWFGAGPGTHRSNAGQGGGWGTSSASHQIPGTSARRR